MLKIDKFLDTEPVIIKISGILDSVTTKEFQNEINDILSLNHKKMIIDFAEISYINSKGIKALIEILKTISSMRGELYFVALSPHIYEIFKVLGLDKVFQVFDNYKDIIAKLT
ncbi:MAG: STAS domain-containing protein [Ignavibacteria bacterium]|jgi:anti-sigma B factor antagonist|nr:STAS domain-containing protein [Ignavibacteria bacterium]